MSEKTGKHPLPDEVDVDSKYAYGATEAVPSRSKTLFLGRRRNGAPARAAYLPDLAGADAGAGFVPSSTECEPFERT